MNDLLLRVCGKIRGLILRSKSFIHLRNVTEDDCREIDTPSMQSCAKSTIFQFPLPQQIHYATVKDRARNSGLTSVGFINSSKVVCCDFNEKKVYFAELMGEDLKIIDTHSTIIADGTPVQTDLIDARGNEFVVSNFYQGSASHYRLIDSKIEFVREINHNSYKNLHGVRFIPGYDSLVWLAYCGGNNMCHQILDLNDDRVIHEFGTDQQCQDIAFVKQFAVVFARTDHIAKGKVKLSPDSQKNIMFASAYIYELPKDLYKSAPKIKRIWRGDGHIDSTKGASDNRIYAANQYLDRVDVFEVADDGAMSLVNIIEQYPLPHGLDIHENNLAVTCYGDSTLRTSTIPIL